MFEDQKQISKQVNGDATRTDCLTRREYQTPELRKWGRVAKLTKNDSGDPGDDAFTASVTF